MKHIVQISTVHRPFSTRIFQRQCRFLVQAGYRVTLLTRHDRAETIDGVDFVPVPSYGSRIVRMVKGSWKAFRIAIALKADVYHFHDPELLPVGVLLKIFGKAPVVYDVHENSSAKILSRTWLPLPLRRIVSLAFSLIEQISVRLLDGVVAVTERIEGQFSHPRSRVVMNYPQLESLERFGGESSDAPGNTLMLYTGGFTRYRGIAQVIAALPLMKTQGARLVVVGRSDGEDFEEELRGIPGFDRVDYRGTVSFDEVYGLMHGAAVGFVCNQPGFDYEYAQPNKLFEYMSAGLPVVASDFELWREVVEGRDVANGGDCGIVVEPTSPQQIAQAADRLLGDCELRRRMGENGRRAVREKHNWEQEGKKLIDLYEELTEGTHG